MSHGTYFPTDVWSTILEMAVDTVANQHKAHRHKVAEYEALNPRVQRLREEFDFFVKYNYNYGGFDFIVDSEWELRRSLNYHHEWFLECIDEELCDDGFDSEPDESMNEIFDHLDSYLS
tara:strand:+ start:894 stop:1250 length:357 start_codon:yes stop_codon:yes gene_type:complete